MTRTDLDYLVEMHVGDPPEEIADALYANVKQAIREGQSRGGPYDLPVEAYADLKKCRLNRARRAVGEVTRAFAGYAAPSRDL